MFAILVEALRYNAVATVSIFILPVILNSSSPDWRCLPMFKCHRRHRR
jgi:hypothetical protein